MLDRSDPRHAHAERRLQRELIIWLTTASPVVQPRSSPVWFWRDGQTFLLFSRPRAGKLAGSAANPRVALHLNDDGVGGDIVTLEGVAELRPVE